MQKGQRQPNGGWELAEEREEVQEEEHRLKEETVQRVGWAEETH
jgi:hypothetical protein